MWHALVRCFFVFEEVCNVYVLDIYVFAHVHSMCVVPVKTNRAERTSDPLELKLQMVVSCRVGVGI